MAHLVRYLSHPQVLINPDIPVPEWSLNDVGSARVQALLKSGAWKETTRVISSDETKAIETAKPLAASFGCQHTIEPKTHENDRSATGFLPPEIFEEIADAFFRNPETSIRGWETAKNAQTRIVNAIDNIMKKPLDGDILVVGHGGVGTLLYCALSDLPIDRRHDQGPNGGGNYFTFDPMTRAVLHHWRPMESP